MIIAFYGVEGSNSATTSNLLATALMSYFHYKKSVLMASLCSGINGLEAALDSGRFKSRIEEEAAYFFHEGMDYVLKEARRDNINSQVIRRAVKELMPGYVFYLSSANGTGWKQIWREFEEHSRELLDAMEEFAEVVFLDCGLGKGSFIRKILERADVIVVNLVQSQRVMEPFFSSNTDFLDKTVYLMGRYDQLFPCNKNRIVTKYQIPEESIGVVPYNAGFQDAFLHGKCAQFIQRNAFEGTYEKNRLFSRELKKSTDLILGKAGYLV